MALSDDQLAAIRHDLEMGEIISAYKVEALLHEIAILTMRLEAAESCARLLDDHLTGSGGFGGKPKHLDCAGCRDAVAGWKRAGQ